MANTTGMSTKGVDLVAYIYDNNTYTTTNKDGTESTKYGIDMKLNTMAGANPDRPPQQDASLVTRYNANGKASRSLSYGEQFMDNIKNFPSQPLESKDGEVIGRLVSIKGDLAPVTNKNGKQVGYRVKQDSVTPGNPIPENTKDLMFQIGRAEQTQIKAEKETAKLTETPAPKQQEQAAEMSQ